MRMLAAFLAAAYVFTAQTPAQAQEGGAGKKPAKEAAGEAREEMTPAQHAEKMLENMNKQLKLSDEQKNKLKPLIENAAAERKAMHDKMQKFDRENSEKIRALLNDEQKEKYDLMRARRKMMGQKMGRRMKEGMGRRRGQGGGGEPGEAPEPGEGGGDHDGPEDREGPGND